MHQKVFARSASYAACTRSSSKGNRIGDLHRHAPDAHLDSCRSQHLHEFPVEIRHRHGPQRQLLHQSVAALQHQLIRKKVESYLDRPLAVRNVRRREPARAHIKRNIPPMIDERRQPQPHFAHNLGPHVQRGAGLPPGIKRQRGPAFWPVGHCWICHILPLQRLQMICLQRPDLVLWHAPERRHRLPALSHFLPRC